MSKFGTQYPGWTDLENGPGTNHGQVTVFLRLVLPDAIRLAVNDLV